jgi:ABC-type transport system involved in Fe-S cluster assembly fused permease/ATPase subunit
MDADWHRRHPAGEVAVAFGRGARGFGSLLFLAVFSVAPTLLELGLSINILKRRFKTNVFGLTALATFASSAGRRLATTSRRR